MNYVSGTEGVNWHHRSAWALLVWYLKKWAVQDGRGPIRAGRIWPGCHWFDPNFSITNIWLWSQVGFPAGALFLHILISHFGHNQKGARPHSRPRRPMCCFYVILDKWLKEEWPVVASPDAWVWSGSLLIATVMLGWCVTKPAKIDDESTKFLTVNQ